MAECQERGMTDKVDYDECGFSGKTKKNPKAWKIRFIMISVVSVAKQRKTLNNMIKSCMYLFSQPSTKAHDWKECEICGDKLNT